MPVSDLCAKGLVTVEKGASVQFAASQMARHHVGSVVVVETDGHPMKPVGILTDRDIALKIVAQNKSLNSLRVGDIMSKKLVTLDKETGLYEAIKKMQQEGVRRLLVVDGEQRLCGLLSADDLVQMLGEEIHSLGALFQKQVWSEGEYFPASDQPSL